MTCPNANQLENRPLNCLGGKVDYEAADVRAFLHMESLSSQGKHDEQSGTKLHDYWLIMMGKHTITALIHTHIKTLHRKNVLNDGEMANREREKKKRHGRTQGTIIEVP